MNTNKILILGVGNVLMGDEGVGISSINELSKIELPENVEVLDGGTGGFHLLSYFENYSKIILIDAALDGKPAGEVAIIEPKFSKDFPKSLSAHDIGLKDLLESAQLLNSFPKIYLITISVAQFQNMGMELSKEVADSIPKVIHEVKVIIKKISESDH
ncbi:MAG: hydrogenase maturation protease [Ignavibacteria bacterium]|nr:hydrogenase maturation protease [Ignavibacteria bacterium]